MSEPPSWAGFAQPGQEGQPGQPGYPSYSGYPGPPGYGEPAFGGAAQPGPWPQGGPQGGAWQGGAWQGGGNAGRWPGANAPVPGGVPLRPLAVGDILSGSFTLIRQNPAATLGLTASVVAVMAAALAIIFVIAANTGGAVALLAVPLVLAGFAVQVGGLAAAQGRGLLGMKIGIADAIRRSRAGWVLLTIVVLAMATAIIWVPLIALLKGWGVIPALLLTAWLAVMTSLAIPVVVLERRGPFAAIGRSWRLILRSYWRVFGIYFLMYLLVWAISAVISLPLGFASGLISGIGSASRASVSVAVVIYAIGEIVIVSLTATIEMSVIVLVYVDMRMRKEGMDLVLRQATQERRLTGDEFASTGFTSAYTGGAYTGGAYTGGAFPGGAFPGGGHPGGQYPPPTWQA